MLTAVLPQYQTILLTAFVCSFASKLSDTFGSEFGKAYGKTTYLITTLQLVPRGTEGAVSLEGTLAGVIGSVLITLVAYLSHVITSLSQMSICIVSAFIASTVESFIGATFQGQLTWLSNEAVNALMTAVGALVSMWLCVVFRA
jgi:uncharacterized protein (TIGR00297 family)